MTSRPFDSFVNLEPHLTNDSAALMIAPAIDNNSWFKELMTTKQSDLPREFGNLQITDVSGDIRKLSKMYNASNPDDNSAQNVFNQRLERLSKTDSGRGLIEALDLASSKSPVEAGKMLADALLKAFKQEYGDKPIDFDQTTDELGVVASMVRITGRNSDGKSDDDSPGGRKESFVNAFNEEFDRAFSRHDTAAVARKIGTDGKSYEVSPVMVLYDEDGRPPGIITAPMGVPINRLHYPAQ
jgi:hypothetical protein